MSPASKIRVQSQGLSPSRHPSPVSQWLIVRGRMKRQCSVRGVGIVDMDTHKSKFWESFRKIWDFEALVRIE